MNSWLIAYAWGAPKLPNSIVATLIFLDCMYTLLYIQCMSTLTVTETRKDFTKIPARLAKKKTDKVLQVTSKGKPVLAVMPWETYASMEATMRILSNPQVMEDIREFEEAEKKGTLKEIKWADLKAQLGI